MQKEQNNLISSQEQNIIAAALIFGYNDLYLKSKQNRNNKENPLSIMAYLSSRASIRSVPAKGFPYVVINKNSNSQFYYNEFVRNWSKKIYEYMLKTNSLNAKTCFQGNLKEILFEIFNDFQSKDLSNKLIEKLLENNHIIELTDLTFMIANQQKVCKLLDENLSKKLTAYLRNQEMAYVKNDKIGDLKEKAKIAAKMLGRGQIINNKLCYNKEIFNELDKLKNGFSNFENK